jgi:tetratricopeptide (TPR) repeat protein
MTCLQRKVLISLSVFLLFSISSCGYVKRTQVKSAIDEAHQELRSGDFQKALDTYQLAYKKYPKDSEMLKSYIKTIEYIEAHGDQAFNAEDFDQAQITYDLLLKNFPRFSNFAKQLSFKKESLTRRLKKSRIFASDKQAQSCLKRGDLQKAIDIYKDLYQQYPSETTVRTRYIRILEFIKEQGDLYFEVGNFTLAGRTYTILLKNCSSLNHLEHFLKYRSELLDTKIEECRKMLFEDGLREYRSGDLSQAISIWRNILTFDPENREVKKAVDRATRQFRNLERIKLGGLGSEPD